MLGIGIKKINLRDYEEYFEIKADLETTNGSDSVKEDISLVECEPSMWLDTNGAEMETLYDEYGLGKMLCLDPTQNLELIGRQTSSYSKVLKMKITKCINTTDAGVPCKVSC